MITKGDEHKSAAQLLRSREAKGLIWSLVARLTFLVVVVALTFSSLTVAQPALMLGVCLVGCALTLYGLNLARREERLRLVGGAGLAFDLLILLLVPFLWYHTYGGPDVSPAYLMKLPLALVILVVMVYNTMALRPAYPAAVAGFSVVLQIALAAYVLGDPRVVSTTDILQVVTGPAVSVNQLIIQVAGTALAGVFLTFLSKAAHQIVHDVVEVEAENRRIVKEQARLLMEVKMTGLANLVAGVAHEMNTPLGATMSSVDTVETCTTKIGEAIDHDNAGELVRKDRKVGRFLALIRDSSGVIKTAGQRMADVVASLKNFARLDEADVQRTDIRRGLDSTLALITDETKRNARVVKDYGDVPDIECRPRELNQVFMTLFMNAFQAMGGEGTLSVRVASSDDRVTVTVSDTGTGMDEERLKTLFHIGFGTKGGRMGMGLGLPTAKSIVERHHGTLSVMSEPGVGTTFSISLPVKAAALASRSSLRN